ncbi:MAG: anthranilate synthase component I [Deltaproteobacteria bacterium]
MNDSNYEPAEFSSLTYHSQGSIDIERRVERIRVQGACDYILDNVDSCRGALFSSSYEYPGRYTQWDIGFINPCLELRSRGLDFSITALSGRGSSLLPVINSKLTVLPELEYLESDLDNIRGRVRQSDTFFVEEMRSRQPTIFTVIRAVKELFASSEDRFLGLYGAFGYDLVFQFEPMELCLERDADQADLVLYLPDELVVVNHRMERAYRIRYSFPGFPVSEGFNGSSGYADLCMANDPVISRHQYGHYADIARHALDFFARGDLFEVVPSQTIYEPCSAEPSQVFKSLRKINPSPYGFIINLGNEFLVGASPEMYVRVEGRRVETCPISGTIKRGKDAIEDSERIRELLNSFKDEAELTMCTDVDRNDKSRVCQPGSVKVIGRRQIEMYSHLIHTVDHVEGILRPEFDSLDAFLTHMWAVTVTGAPKRAAVRWLEQNEDSARGWYGGAVGFLSFNGDLNTGLTLRTIRIKNGIAQIRVGATLLYDSIPESEEAETYLKAAAMMKALQVSAEAPQAVRSGTERGKGKKILLVDHEDSFVHTLANYFRQTGAEVEVLRGPLARRVLEANKIYDLVILSPGPGRPQEFALGQTIGLCLDRSIPIFGVCLGLQGLVEYFGGSLGQLDYPQHGKTSRVRICGDGPIWRDLPQEFSVGRYHSLYASSLPECLTTSAISEDGVVMAVEHVDMPVAAVQFHPESIMTAGDNNGLRLIGNIVEYLS